MGDAFIRLTSAKTGRVSGRRGAKRSERSEDGTPEARDPPEGLF